MKRSRMLPLALVVAATWSCAGPAGEPRHAHAQPEAAPVAERIRATEGGRLPAYGIPAQVRERLAALIEDNGTVDGLIADIERELGPVVFVDGVLWLGYEFASSPPRDLNVHVWFSTGDDRYHLVIQTDSSGNLPENADQLWRLERSGLR